MPMGAKVLARFSTLLTSVEYSALDVTNIATPTPVSKRPKSRPSIPVERPMMAFDTAITTKPFTSTDFLPCLSAALDEGTLPINLVSAKQPITMPNSAGPMSRVWASIGIAGMMTPTADPINVVAAAIGQIRLSMLVCRSSCVALNCEKVTGSSPNFSRISSLSSTMDRWGCCGYMNRSARRSPTESTVDSSPAAARNAPLADIAVVGIGTLLLLSGAPRGSPLDMLLPAIGGLLAWGAANRRPLCATTFADCRARNRGSPPPPTASLPCLVVKALCGTERVDCRGRTARDPWVVRHARVLTTRQPKLDIAICIL
eukprot:m.64084 g.64084  ORF g.64084 m.64084 type:complete len:315 (+) comp17838_c0_seq5:861-1805(+)